MQINIIQDDKSITTHKLQEDGVYHVGKASALVSPSTKLEAHKELFFCEQNAVTAVCFDSSMKNIREKCESLGITRLDDQDKGVEFGGARALFFTSGTTAEPRGAIKTAQMIELEVAAQVEYLSKYEFDSFLVSVPLYHIYGYLWGYAIPKAMGREVYTKELFMPQNIIDFCAAARCVCVTTPVFLKAMLKMGEAQNLQNSLFISSTGAMSQAEVDEFFDKFNAEIVQIYGSTETGGVGVKERTSRLCVPLKGVKFGTDEESRLLIDSPYLSSEIFEGDITPLASPFQTSDIVRLEEDGFEIVGRSFELLKIGGKRVSIPEIEATLEKHPQIPEAQVIPVRAEGLKDERIEILAVTQMSEKELSDFVSKALKELYSGIKINAKCRKVEALEKTFNGKKKRS